MTSLDRLINVTDSFDTRHVARVRPADVLAALSDEQREAMAQLIIPVYARQERLSPTGGRVHEAATAVVDAICGGAA